METNIQTKIETLGTPQISSPIDYKVFTNEDDHVLYNISYKEIKSLIQQNKEVTILEKAGAREKIFFNPSDSTAAIVSCGGLCPGINNVIRSIVMQLYYIYGVKNIFGIRYGYFGFTNKCPDKPMPLNPSVVSKIANFGGSFLGSSRGNQSIDEIIDCLINLKINMLFTIGGDGTLRGAQQIVNEIKKRNLNISVIGIPKTIDNDISYVAKSFGFETAFSEAVQSIESAHAEALGAPYGIGLVKLMGRHSGFIAANAALARKEVNFVLIPELDFDLNGEKGFLNKLKQRLDDKNHAVIVVAEGAGQKFFDQNNKKYDSSGNVKLNDIGIYLKDQITTHFKSIGYDINLKYIDPSYIIRSVPANANDGVFCGLLAQNAVHAAMAGKTNMVIGVWNNIFVHIPINLVISKRKQVILNGKLWQSVIESTGQQDMINY